MHGRAANGLKKAVAFVDYEHWYISLLKNYGLAPNIKGWIEELGARVNLTEAVFFADFSHRSLADEIRRIRPFSNKIIDTRSTMGVKKDFTDFIMLDNMYQKALSSDDIETFVLFSGDGHFSSVTSFLKNFYSKEVGVYGIRGSFSRQLQDSATWCVTLPMEDEIYGAGIQLILECVKNAKTTVTASYVITEICKNNKGITSSSLNAALKKLVSEGYITERRFGTDPQKNKQTDPVLFVDWDRVQKSSYFR